MSNSGSPAAVGAGAESAFGTAVARTVWKRIKLCDVKEEPVPISKYSLPGTNVPMEHAFVADRMQTGGKLEMEAAYDDATAFYLAYLFGKAPAEGGGGGPLYTHTYTWADPNSTLAGFTLENIKNRIASTTYSDLIEGGTTGSGSLTIPDNGAAILSLDVIAETTQARATAGSPTFHTGMESTILGWHGGNLTWSSLAGPIKSLTLTINRNLSRRWLTGSQYTLQPKTAGLYEVTLQIVREFDENTMYAASKALTQADAAITYTGPSSQTLAIALHNAQVVPGSYSDPITNPGVNDQSFTLKGRTDGTDLGISIVLTNTNSLYTAN